MPDENRFATIVQARPAQVDADDHLARYGRLHPRHQRLQLGYDWEVRDVTSGQTIATGYEEDAEDASARDQGAGRGRRRGPSPDRARRPPGVAGAPTGQHEP
jgi:hypothetical protein